MPVEGKEIRTADDLVADVEARIASGELSPRDRLDPVRRVADRLGLAPNTVAAAYRILGERGLVIGEGRRGTFVAARPPIAVPMAEPLPEGLVDLSSGNPDPDLLPDLVPALAAISPRHSIYGEAAVEARLAELLRLDLAADGVASEHLCVVGGALDGIERSLAARLRPGDRVGIEDPGYASVNELVSAMAFRSEPIAIDEFGLLPSSVEAALDKGLSAVIVTPRAQNPTGAALDDARAAELRQIFATSPELLIIEDDHAGLVAGQPYCTVVPESCGRWAMVRSVAKSLGPDLRLAAMVGDPTTISRVAGRQFLGTGWVSHLLQRIVAQLLMADDLPQSVARAADAYTLRRNTVVDVLNAGGLDVHGRSGMNVWVPVADEAAVIAGMQRRGFALRAGARFRTDSPPGVRISTAGSDPETLGAAAEALLATIGSQQTTRSV